MHTRTVGAKLFFSSALALLLTIVISMVALNSISTLGSGLVKTLHSTVRKQALAGNVAYELSNMLSLERGIRLRTYMKDPAAVEAYHGQFQQSAEKFKADLVEMAPLLVTAEGKSLNSALQAAGDQIAQKNDAICVLSKAGRLDEAGELDTREFRPLVLDSVAKAERLLQQQADLMAGDDADANAAVASKWWTISILLLLAFGAGSVSMLIIHRMSRKLRLNIGSLNDGAEFVASAAGEVSSSSRSLAEGASRNAASLEETSAASEEINAVARRNIDSAKSTAEIVEKSQGRAVEANLQLDQMVKAMDEINGSSAKISKIIKVIDEIAFQTNILALNAAVEAARAGEAGMGFAVVADEVRSLAQRCTQAAKDTAELIEESLHSSSGGKQKVGMVAEAVRALTSDSAGIRVLVDEISAGSEEQARGMTLIAASLMRMEQTTQSTAAAAEQSAAAAAELHAQSATLKNVVRQLYGMVNGEQAAVVSPATLNPVAARPGRSPAERLSPAASASPRATVVSLKSTFAPGHFTPGHFDLQPSRLSSAEVRSSFPLEEDFKEF